MMVDQLQTNSDKALRTARTFWKSILIGLLVFFFAATYGRSFLNPNPQPEMATMFTLMSAALLVVSTPIGYFLRDRIWFGKERLGKIPHAKLVPGCIVLWAMLDATSIAGITGILVSGQVMPCVLPAAIAFGLLVINRPNADRVQ